MERCRGSGEIPPSLDTHGYRPQTPTRGYPREVSTSWSSGGHDFREAGAVTMRSRQVESFSDKLGCTRHPPESPPPISINPRWVFY